MWKPHLQDIAEQVGRTLHALDRFHVLMHLNRALDYVSRRTTSRLRAQGCAENFKQMRWKLHWRSSCTRGNAQWELRMPWATKLATASEWMLNESFEHLWRHKSPASAEALLRVRCTKAMCIRIKPLTKVARMLRAHQPLLLNRFRAKGDLCTVAIDGFNKQLRMVT
jgi:transposase